MLSGLAELKQLHVGPNIEHSLSLHCSSTNCRRQKSGNKARYERVEPSGLAMLEQLHLQSNSEHSCHLSSTFSNSHSLMSMWSGHTYARAMRGMMWISIVIPIIFSGCTYCQVAYCLHGLNITLPVFSLAFLAADPNPPTASRERASLSQDISDPCVCHLSMKRLAVMRPFNSSPSSFPILPQSGCAIPASRRALCIVSPFSTSPAAWQSVLPYLMANNQICDLAMYFLPGTNRSFE